MANSIDSERKRKALKPRQQPYRHTIKPLQYLAYRRNKIFDNGRWIAILVRSQHSLGLEADLTYSDALDAAMRWFAANAGTVTVNATVETALQDYKKHLEVQKTAETARNTDARIRKHISSALLDTKLAALTTRQIKLFQNGMVKKSDDPEEIRKSKDSANRVMNMLKAALNLAYRDGQVGTDAAWKRVDSFRNVGAARILFLTDEQVSCLLEATHGGLHDLVEVAIHTGARYGELTSARVSDFDPVNGTIQLSGKTGTRTTYLSDAAVKVIKKLCRNKLPAALLLSQNDGQPWFKNSHSRSFKDAVILGKLPADTVFYSLRHYHISKALLAGVNSQVVAENTGTSITMIERHYGKFQKADRREMFNQIDLGGLK